MKSNVLYINAKLTLMIPLLFILTLSLLNRLCQGVSSDFCHGPELNYKQAAHWCLNKSSSLVVPRNAAENGELSDYLIQHEIESTWTGALLKPALWHNSSGTSL